MIRKGIVIDPHTSFKIEYECTYEDKRVDDMYYKVNGKDLIPIAYIYPIENKDAVLAQLQRLVDAKKAFDDIQSDVFYRQFTKLRG